MGALSQFGLRYVRQILPLHTGEFVIGRSPACQVILDDEGVSRQHAVLEVQQDRLSIQDLNSRTGLRINDQPLTGRRLLSYGDRIQIGGQELVVVDAHVGPHRATVPPAHVPNRRPKVLIVDDSRTIRQRVELILGKAGFEVLSVDMPFAATAMVERERPDLVLLDVGMPALSGDQLVSFMRKQESLHDTKLVLYSSWPAEQLRRIVLECGADGFIQKTPDPEQFVQECRSWIPWAGAVARP